MNEAPKKEMIASLRKVLKRLHYPIEVMLVCVRWYAAYPLSLRHIEEMMAERGVFVDHTTVHRWAGKNLAHAGRCTASAQTPRGNELAYGRDLYQGRGPMDVSSGRP